MKPRLSIAFAAVALVAILVAAQFTISRRRPSQGAPGPPPKAEAIGSEVPLASPKARPGATVDGLSRDASSIRFKLKLAVADRPPKLDEPLVFCVPPGRDFVPEIASYRIGGREIPIKDASKAGSEGVDAAKSIAVKTVGVMRRWTLASVEFKQEMLAPFAKLKKPEWGELEAEIVLNWGEPFAPPAAPPFPAEADPARGWGRVAAALVANPGDLAAFQMEKPAPHGPPPASTAPWDLFPGDRKWARLRIKDEGFYRVRVDDLLGAGFPSESVKPQDLRLFNAGKAVPLRRDGEGAQQKVYLWNPAPDSKFTAERVYWATMAADLPDPAWADVDAAALAGEPRPQPTTLRTATIDRDNQLKIESGNFLAIKNIQWVDAPLKAGEPLATPLEFRDYAAPEGNLDATLKVYSEGNTSAARVQVDLSKQGRPVGTALLNSSLELEKELPIPAAFVKEGKNEFAVTWSQAGAAPNIPATGSLWFDRLSVEYPSRPTLVDGKLALRSPKAAEPFTAWTEVARADAPALSQTLSLAIGAEGKAMGKIPLLERNGAMGFLWPCAAANRVEIQTLESVPLSPRFEIADKDALASESGGADYLILYHRDFAEAAKKLGELRQAGGLRVRMAEIQSVYDSFSHGEQTPEAIRSLLAYTLGSWRGGAPSYVLLIGDCTSDYLGKARAHLKNWVPTFTYDAGADDWASDHWLAVAAGPDDIADFMLGRISVETTQDADAIARKIADYQAKPKPGPWRARMAFVSDNGGFIQSIEELRKDQGPEAFEDRLAYLDDKALMEDNWFLPKDVVRDKRLKVSPILTQKILDCFRDGTAYITYYGHGSPNIWMEERVWFGGDSSNSDNQNLAGLGYPAFVTTMTCNTGAIDYPVPKGMPGGGWNICISEDMMRQPDGGAIALFVPSGPSITSLQQKMAIALHRALFDSNLRGLGEATTLAKTRYSINAAQPTLPYMFILLGDPALELQMAGPEKEFALSPSAYRPGDRIRATVTGVAPRGGKYDAQLVSEAGEEIWASRSAAFTDGRIPLEVLIAEEAPLGKATLRLYAWGEGASEETAAFARVEIGRPKLEIASVQPHAAEGEGLVLSIANKGPLPSRNAKAILSAEGSAKPLEEKSFALAADAATSLTLSAKSAPKGEGPLIVRLSIESDDPPAGEASKETRERLVALPPAKEWAGIVPQLSRWKKSSDGLSAQVTAALAGGAGAPRAWNVGISAAEGAPIQQQQATLRDGRAEATFTIAGEALPLAEKGTLWLAGIADAEGRTTATVSRAPLAELPRPQPKLRIKPESIKVDPPDPFDGQTILAQVEVENAGEAESAPFTAGLYTMSPALGGTPLLDHIHGTSQIPCEAIAPGQSRKLLLRCDPVDNAGEFQAWVSIQAPQGEGTSTDGDLRQPFKIVVRKKADIQRGATRLATEGEGASRKYWLEGEVKNVGGVDSYNVTVIFYRNETLKTPENELGRGYLPVVPAGGEMQTARVEWRPSEKDLAPGVELPKPYHAVSLNPMRRSVAPTRPKP